MDGRGVARVPAPVVSGTDDAVRLGRSERFAKVPEWVLYHPDLSAQDVRVYGALHRHADDGTGRAFPGLARLGDLLGVSESTCSRSVRALAKVGAVDIEVERRHGGMRRRNTYVVHELPVSDRLDLGTGDRRGLHGCKPGAVTGASREPSPAGGNETQVNENQVNEGTPAPAPPTRAHQQAGRDVARHVWEHRTPRPSGKFIALSRLFEDLLDAGWKPEQVTAAAMASPAFTRDALEFQLNGCGRRRPARPGGPFEVDDDRAAPAGVVNL